MSVENYYTATSQTSFSLSPQMMKEAVTLLCQHSPAEIFEVRADTSDEYDVIVYAGFGDHYVRFRIYFETNPSPIIFRQKGIVSGGVFSGTGSRSSGGNSDDHESNKSARVRIINGGDVWELGFPRYNYGLGYSNRWDESALAAKFKPQYAEMLSAVAVNRKMDNAITYSNGLTVRFQNAERVLYGTTRANADRNIPSGKEILFPSLWTIAVQNSTFGVPTINGKTIYMAYPELDMGTEFYVGGERFVSLGTHAIRSI